MSKYIGISDPMCYFANFDGWSSRFSRQSVFNKTFPAFINSKIGYFHNQHPDYDVTDGILFDHAYEQE